MNYQDRTKRLLHLLEGNNLDGALISSSANIYYLTGIADAGCMLIVSAKSLTIIAEKEPVPDNSAAIIYLRPGAIEEGVKDTINRLAARLKA
jgi:Xaa-Pro aminopeptidase